MYPLCFSFGDISHVTASDLYFFVSLVASTGGKLSSTFSFVSFFVTSASPRYLKFFKPAFSAYFVISMWSMWLPLSPSLIFIIFCLYLDWCFWCRGFYPLGWLLAWPLVSCPCLVIHQSVLLPCLLLIQILFPHHFCPPCHFILWSGMVCLHLVVLLPQLRHRHQCYPTNHPHCTRVPHNHPGDISVTTHSYCMCNTTSNSRGSRNCVGFKCFGLQVGDMASGILLQ